MDERAVGMKKRKRRIKIKNDEKGFESCREFEDDQILHISTERERRKKMRNMFSSLRDLLPPHNLPIKADKSSIVDEAVKHIKTLEHNLQTLQKQRMNNNNNNNHNSNNENVDKTRGLFLDDINNNNNENLDKTRGLFLDDINNNDNDDGGDNNGILIKKALINRISSNFKTWFSPNVVVNMLGEDAQISICSPKHKGILVTIFYILHRHNLDVVSCHISSDLCRTVLMIHVHASGNSDELTEGSPVEDRFKLAAGEMNKWILSCH